MAMPDVIMPRLTDSMQEGAIAKWLKADGDEVRRGEELVEIETDKATMAYEADFDGVLRIVVAEGETVPVGTVIGQIGEGALVAAPAGDAAASASSASSAASASSASGGSGGSGVSGAVGTSGVSAAPATPRAPAVDANGGGGDQRRPRKPGASPLARRIAQRLGVDLASISGSGAHGRILKLDVVAAAGRGGALAAEPGTPVAAAPELQPLNRTQSIVARRMAESRQTVPDFALGVDVDMSECLRMRSELKALASPAPSLNDLIVKACALALRRHPRANGSFADNGFELHERVNVAVAVAADDALVAPVVADADRKTVGQIAADTRRLIDAVREGRVAPADLEGGTFTVSNLGMYGIERFEGIINPPQAAILCVGAVADRPVAVDGELAIRPIASMTLAADHRILYGADAAAFLTDVRRLLERPLGMAL
jgi:pyruvate dehydrogenase E2 component (dihydrolipoamide acetyltransferase)